jgi:hypothetical protein
MDLYFHLRASAITEGFDASMKALGIDARTGDSVWQEIDEVLLGADLALLEANFPPDPAGRRLALTNAAPGLPALRVAFRIDLEDAERIIYLDCAPR